NLAPRHCPAALLSCGPMAKARAILKRRKAVKNIRKITKTMQMIATAKFQKSLKRATGTKPYTAKVRELVEELAGSVGNVEHPLLRRVTPENRTNRIALVVLTSDRGLAGAYNGSVLRAADRFMKAADAAGTDVDLYCAGKKGLSFFKFQGREIKEVINVSDEPQNKEVVPVADLLIEQFTSGQIDSVQVAYMNFISTGVQKPEVTGLLPLSGVREMLEDLAKQAAERDAQIAAGMLDTSRSGEDATETAADNDTGLQGEIEYDFSPSAEELLDELLPLTVKSAFFQCFLDATTSEHVARMVAMKSATDNADKMGKTLQLQYNRARQSQITTELSEIMGGVEAMG
ncbi:MAG: ATP synthase F1 subunit gamma, partial [Planctomycetota bacterium]